MANESTVALANHPVLKAWEKVGFAEPPPSDFVNLAKDYIREVVAVEVATGGASKSIDRDAVRERAIAATGFSSKSTTPEPVLRVIESASDEIIAQLPPRELTRLLRSMNAELSAEAVEIKGRVFEIARTHLYCMAAAKLRDNAGLRERYRPSDLVQDFYLKFHNAEFKLDWANRRQFFAFARKVFDNLLRDNFKTSKRDKRAAFEEAVPIRPELQVPSPRPRHTDLIAAREALEHLRSISPRQHRIYVLHVIEGLGIEEIARQLEVGTATVGRDLRLAKGTLRNLLEERPRR